MTAAEILRQLERLTPTLPRQALQAAVKHREAVTPGLLAALERAASEPNKIAEDAHYMLHVYAMYLLAQFREPAAFDPIVKILSLPGDLPFDLAGDIVTETGSRLMASVCAGNTTPLMKLAEDENVHPLVRGEGIETFAVLVAWDEKPKAEAVAYYRELFQSKLVRPGHRDVWVALLISCCNINAQELLPEIRQAFLDGVVTNEDISLPKIEESLGQRGEELFKWFAESHPRIMDTAGELGRWSTFREKEEAVQTSLSKALHAPGGVKPPPYVAPKKIGRNDPCHCGSGKKFKKCCGAAK